MSEATYFKVRMFYAVQGRLVFLSHLEVARTLERIVRRAQLPFAITEGFSPHMKITFGMALPVGIGGLNECFDLSLTEYRNVADLTEEMRKACPPDLMIESAVYIGKSEPAASIAYPLSTYRAQLSGEIQLKEVPEKIRVIKKKKEKELIVGDYLREIECKGSVLKFTLEAKSSGSLRADAFLAEILKEHPHIDVLSCMRIAQKTI